MSLARSSRRPRTLRARLAFTTGGSQLAAIALPLAMLACSDVANPGDAEPPPRDGSAPGSALPGAAGAGDASSAGDAGRLGSTHDAGATYDGATNDGTTNAPDGGAGSAAPVPTGPVLYAAPSGTDAAPGTLAQPTSLAAAIARVAKGGAILLRGGTYRYATQLTVDAAQSGSPGTLTLLRPYEGEQPVLDFSSQPYGSGTAPRGLQLNASYWRVYGLEVVGSADNGIYVAGSHNVVEACVTHGNRDSGLQIGRASSAQAMADWPADNLILHCESYDNYDAPPGSGENADGFAAKLTVGSGNVFRGCVAHHNIDDGWDLYTKGETGPIGPVTLDQCVAHHNGTLRDGTSNENGDRNGFKLGGEKIAVGHTVTRSIAFANGKNGFTWNSNPGAIRLVNNLAFDNAEGNYNFGSSAVRSAAQLTNNVSFWTSAAGSKADKALANDVEGTNVFWDPAKSPPSVSAKGLTASGADFAAPLSGARVGRGADGSLVLSAFALARGSDFVNAGVLPSDALPFDAAAYYVGAPDLGAVELR